MAKHLMIVILALVALMGAAPAVMAEKATTNQTVAQTVRNHQQQCNDLDGTFTTGSWTTPGEQPGTMVTTTFTTCDLGGGDSTTCHHTPGSVECRATVTAPPEGRYEVTSPDDAMADDPIGSPPDVRTADPMEAPDESHPG